MSEQVEKRLTPSPLYLAFFLLVLGVICAGLLAVVNAFTAPVIAANEKEEVRKSLESIGVSNATDVSDEYTLIENIENVYTGIADNVDVLVFKTKHKNKYTSVQTLIVLNKEDGKIVNVKVLGKCTTHGYDNLFSGDLGVNGQSSNTFENYLILTANATFSRGSVQTSISQAFKMFEIIKGGN